MVEAARGPLWGCGSVVEGRTVAAEGVSRDRVAGITIKASTLRHKQTPPLLQASLAAFGVSLSDLKQEGVVEEVRRAACAAGRSGSDGRRRAQRAARLESLTL